MSARAHRRRHPRQARRGAAADRGSALEPKRVHHVIHQQAQSRPSVAADQCAGADAPPIRRQHVHPVRRLRPRFGDGGDHRGLLGPRRCGPNSWSSCPASAARRRPPPISSAARMDSIRCTAACRRSRAARMPPIGDLTYVGVSGRRRFAVHRHRSAGARHPPQREHAVSDREQRRLRPDQGPVLGLRRYRHQGEARRRQFIAADRSGAAGAVAWARPSSRAASPATRRSSCR